MAIPKLTAGQGALLRQLIPALLRRSRQARASQALAVVPSPTFRAALRPSLALKATTPATARPAAIASSTTLAQPRRGWRLEAALARAAEVDLDAILAQHPPPVPDQALCGSPTEVRIRSRVLSFWRRRLGDDEAPAGAPAAVRAAARHAQALDVALGRHPLPRRQAILRRLQQAVDPAERSPEPLVARLEREVAQAGSGAFILGEALVVARALARVEAESHVAQDLSAPPLALLLEATAALGG